MSIISGKIKWIVIAILVIIAGAAVYVFDPLGWRTPPVVVAPKPKAPPPHVVPHPASKLTPVSAPVSAAVSAPASAMVPASAVPVSEPAAAAVMAEPAPALQPPLQLSKSLKTGTAKPVSPKSADLRYCLKLATDAAIAKCAGE